MRSIIALFKKDLKLIFLKKNHILEPLLLGFIFIFSFSLASSNLGKLNPIWTGTIFWICSVFCSVLIFRELYNIEEVHKVWELLLVSPISVEGIYLTKTIVGVCILFIIQCIFLVLMTVFLKLNGFYYFYILFPIIIIINWGVGIINSFFSGAMGFSSVKDSLITTILFPIQIPLLLAGIKIWEDIFNLGTISSSYNWVKLIIGFDCIFSGICIFLFPFLFSKR